MNSYNQKKNTYVKEQLLKALLKMMESKSIDEISIYDLIKEAGVSRVSFYRNYASKKDILIQEDQRLFQAWNNDYQSRNKDETLDYIKELLDFYQSNSDFYFAIERADLSDIIMNTMIKAADIKDEDPNPIAYFKSSVAYMVYGWVHEWIKRGMKESGEELSRMMHQSIDSSKANGHRKV